MSDQYKIEYVLQKNINPDKWDACIDKASNGLIYAYSYYLDQMAENWDALVLNDYEIVMPLTWNSKFGIHYLYQPFITAELGVFGNNLNEEILEVFLNSIPKKFKYWDISLNHGNVFQLKSFDLYTRINYILDLNRSYEELYKNYSENIQRNIKKAEQAGCIAKNDFDPENVVQLALKQMKHYSKNSDDNAERFRYFYKYLHANRQATTYGVFSKENKLLSSCVFFFSHHRAYYILVGNDPAGKDVGASHGVINAFIKDHAGKNMLLDFEGSDIPGLALFYKSFGAREEKYSAIRLNKLPFYLKWLKK